MKKIHLIFCGETVIKVNKKEIERETHLQERRLNYNGSVMKMSEGEMGKWIGSRRRRTEGEKAKLDPLPPAILRYKRRSQTNKTLP